MSSTTSRLGLYKPASDGSENVNVVTDLNNNWDQIDSAIGAVTVTSSTRPAAPYAGQFIRESDTGKAYVHNGSSPASGGWLQVLIQGATFDSGLSVNGGVQASGAYDVRRTSTGQTFHNGYITGDSVARYTVLGDGKIEWGAGGASTRDVNLFRQSPGLLATNGSLNVASNLTAAGSAAFGGIVALNGGISGNLTVPGNLSVGGVGKLLWTRKTADQSLAVSSTAYQNLVIGASGSAAWSQTYDVGEWEIEGAFYVIGPASADVNVRWTFTTGSSSRLTVGYAGPATGMSTLVSGDGDWIARVNYTTSPIDGADFGLYDFSAITIQFRGVLIANVAGTLQPQAAQATSNATAVIFKQDSYWKMTRRA